MWITNPTLTGKFSQSATSKSIEFSPTHDDATIVKYSNAKYD